MSAGRSGGGAVVTAPLAILAFLLLSAAGPAAVATKTVSVVPAALAAKAAVPRPGMTLTAPAKAEAALPPANTTVAPAPVEPAKPAAGAATEAHSQIDVTNGNLAIGGYDPVAYFLSERAERGSKQFEYKWNGAVWRFASAHHEKAFEAAPTKYAPQYGGYSAYNVSRGQLADSDPTVWSVVDGKLYLNHSEEVRDKWLAAIWSYIETANLNWKKLRSSETE